MGAVANCDMRRQINSVASSSIKWQRSAASLPHSKGGGPDQATHHHGLWLGGEPVHLPRAATCSLLRAQSRRTDRPPPRQQQHRPPPHHHHPHHLRSPPPPRPPLQAQQQQQQQMQQQMQQGGIWQTFWRRTATDSSQAQQRRLDCNCQRKPYLSQPASQPASLFCLTT